MDLTPALANKIAERYDRQTVRSALSDLFHKRGLAMLTDDARRDLILSLGADRRSAEARQIWHRNGGDTSRPWSQAYRAMLNAAFRRHAVPFKQAAE